ncbi:MAG: response regulator [Oligoflexia bacterium]|nr:response regulator [Oligoflexia bacterium]
MESLLIVDDEIEICELIESYVGDMFSTVKMATTIKDAVEVVKAEEFAIIIFDLNIHGLNGGEIFKAARSEGSPNQNTPSLAISGFFTDNFIEKNEGTIEMLKKPFTGEEITDKVFKMLSEKSASDIKESKESMDDIDALFDEPSVESGNEEPEKPVEQNQGSNAQSTDFLKNLTKK